MSRHKEQDPKIEGFGCFQLSLAKCERLPCCGTRRNQVPVMFRAMITTTQTCVTRRTKTQLMRSERTYSRYNTSVWNAPLAASRLQQIGGNIQSSQVLDLSMNNFAYNRKVAKIKTSGKQRPAAINARWDRDSTSAELGPKA